MTPRHCLTPSPELILRLQTTAGNRAVQRLLEREQSDKKLNLNQGNAAQKKAGLALRVWIAVSLLAAVASGVIGRYVFMRNKPLSLLPLLILPGVGVLARVVRAAAVRNHAS